MKAKFKKFLTGNRAYSKFVRNIKNERNMCFSEYCSIKGIDDRAITSVLSWHETPEDYDYWDALDNKWNEQSTS